jgi:hypothetical protein
MTAATTGLRLLTASERLAEPRGPKILIAGVPGVGKTSLLRTLSPEALATTLFVDAEAGDLAVAGLEIASVRPRTWSDCRDIACALGGPNPALPASASYSEAHYQAVAANPVLAGLAKHTGLFVDSLTEISRQCRAWAEQQPESFTERGKKDLRGTYGLVAREMVGRLQQVHHDRARTVVLVGILEKDADDPGAWRIQLEGQRTARELPGIIDVIATLHHINFGDGKPIRALVCANPNSWTLPAKDRSGKLEQFEEPDLGKLLAKLTPSSAAQATQETTHA